MQSIGAFQRDCLQGRCRQESVHALCQSRGLFPIHGDLIPLVQQYARTQWDALETADLNPVITTASRYSWEKFKHSFHAVFPSIGFSLNNGIIKSFAQHFSSLPELQGLSAKGEPMPIIDAKVYSRNQVFRIVESWKFTDTPAKDAVLRFQPE
jgi:hypothetical protein